MLFDNQIVKLVIASGDQIFINSTVEMINRCEEFSVVSTTSNGDIALTDIKAYRPQLILLAVELSSKDGFGVIEAVHKISESYRPKIILVANQMSQYVISKADMLNVDYLFTKPVNETVLLKRLRQLAEGCLVTENISTCGIVPTSFMRGAEKEKQARAAYYLNCLRIYPNLTGYYYLRTAICMVVDDLRLINNMTIRLYPTIAKMFDVTPQSVERAMRHAIEVGFRRADLRMIEYLFSFSIDEDKGKPSNSEFIALIADRIRNELAFTE